MFVWPKFYTYVWLRENGTPYYVGKGTRRRAIEKHRIGEAPPIERITIYSAASDAEAVESEVALIWYYGCKDLGLGCLRNFTDGGEGSPGHANRKPLDFIGKTFGNLIVLKRDKATAGDTHAMWLCKCLCGKEISVRSMHLKSGRTKSCGCMKHTEETKHKMSISHYARQARIRGAHV
jgi:hypothetical protein